MNTHNAVACQKLFILRQLGLLVCAVSQCHLFNADYILTLDTASSIIHHATHDYWHPMTLPNLSLTWIMYGNINDNSFSGHAKFTLWNVIL